ncbi:glycosyltransferase [Malaciobacter marinus]|uniref:glycosyltransferase n=1 Tax=Malaciobacter marinus TaxID=505249 RepID=UPI0009A8300E|nr:glycosyltransferase [Malaciobacter marinus]SKB26457.1 Glycosyl transferase family 2 [Malaciobacter marinus]
MSNPLVSVVMSVYNSEKYLHEAIESILNQTYTNFEFIIINDGSTDSSLSIIEENMKKDERIVLISRENKGLPYSLNEGIEKAQGKYIARMDADDISLTSRFEEQVRFMEENAEIGICGTAIEVFSEKEINSKIYKNPENHSEMKVRLLFSVCFAHPSVMIKKEILNKYGLEYNIHYTNAQDYELWSKISEVTTMANISKILLKYRVSENSITTITDTKRSELRYKLLSDVFKKYIDQLAIKNTEEENRLHFIIGLNERIVKADIDLRFLSNYLDKLIEANKKTKVFDETYLEQFLAKKFLIVVYYKIKKKDISFLGAAFYGLFWKASFDIIKGKLK